MDALVRDYLERAGTCVRQAEVCFGAQDYPTSISRSAEAVEFALKSAIKLTGHAHERKHDVSDGLAKAFQDFPSFFKQRVPRFRMLSRVFTSLSLDAKYGDEMLNFSPKGMFCESEARTYLECAREVLSECVRLQHEMEKSGAGPG